MVAEKIHIYLPSEIELIEPMSELELCAEYFFRLIHDESKSETHYSIEGYCPYYVPPSYSMEIVARVVQLLSNAGWDIKVINCDHIYIHKRHFE